VSEQKASAAKEPPPAASNDEDGKSSTVAEAKPAETEKTDAKEKNEGPDEAVCRAFALGWQVSRLREHASTDSRIEPDPDGRLPGLSSLSGPEQTALGIAQVEAATHLVEDRLRAAGVATPSTTDVRRAFRHGSGGDVRTQVHVLHRRLLLTFTAADFRIGKAYGLGRTLADTCHSPRDLASLQHELQPYRLLNLQEWLADLHSAFPAHAARAVSLSLDQWRRWAEQPVFGRDPLDWSEHHEAVRRTLARQGHLWRALLSGEKAATDMLSPDDYLTAADGLLERTRVLVRSVLTRHPEITYGALFFVLLALFLLLFFDGTGKILAGLAAAAAALGITWKGVGGALASVGAKLEQPLWGAELDYATAAAITRLPGEAPVVIDRAQETATLPSGPPSTADAGPRPAS
jgi:hypothetical protein